MTKPIGDGMTAFVTAGARIDGELAQSAGTDLKALVAVEGRTLLSGIISSLRATPGVGSIVVIGPVAEMEGAAREAGADDFLPEGMSGAENLLIGMAAYREALGDRHSLFVASDLPFLTTDALEGFLARTAASDADIVYPIVPRPEFERAYPAVPKTYAKLSEGEFTGGSVMRLRARSLLDNRVLIEKVYEARKSQVRMAQLLGWNFALRYGIGKLTVEEAEARASELTGCRCLALRDADPRLAYDIDDLTDYGYAIRSLRKA